MILDRIRLSSYITTDLKIKNALPDDPYLLKAVDGLGPPPVDVYISQTLTQGGVYKGRRPQNREITFRIGLNPDHAASQSASDLRTALYSMLAPNIGDYVFIKLMTSSSVVHSQIYGYVKTFEINQFTADPEVAITIACVDPYFSAPEKVVGLPTAKAAFMVTNVGNAPTGLYMELTFTANRSGIEIALVQPFTAIDKLSVKSTYEFKSGDKLLLNTIPGQRYIHVIRNSDGKNINIINTMTANSDWIMLPGGSANNDFTVDTTAFNWNKFEYTPQYWGI